MNFDQVKNKVLTNFIAGNSITIISKNLELEVNEVERIIRNFLVAKLNME